MPLSSIATWIAGLGFAKLSSFIAGMGVLFYLFYKYSFEICLMGAMISIFFAMFGLRFGRTGTLFFVALYVILQILGVAL